ncbi:MAG: hypothetical protein IJ655_08425 [Lachnospiraceae bacterium]|nr:hypothetical protein [Lachnospiraceae bacterium]
MNTKPIPIIITLIAALVSCVASILQHVSFTVFTTRLLCAVIIFGVMGSIVKVVLDKSINVMEEEEGDDENEESELEDVISEDTEE